MGSQRARTGLPSPESTRSFWHSQLSETLRGHRTTDDLPTHADVVVIGSGITGAFAARHLVQGGRGVMMLEAREACSGATGRNGGHCQPAIYSAKPHLARFELSTYEMIRDLVERERIPCDFRVVGGVHALPTQELVDLAAKSIRRLRRDHPDLADKAVLHTQQRELERLRVLNAVGAVVQSHAAKCWPYKLVAWVLETLLQHAAETFNLQTWTPVTRLTRNEDESWAVWTPRGEVTAKQVLLATNAYTPHLLPALADVIVPVRGQVAALKPPRDGVPLEHSHVWLPGRSDDYLIERSEGEPVIIVGGERMSVPGGGEGIWKDDAIDEHVARSLRRSLHSALKLRNGDKQEEEELEASYEWTGVMGYSKDGHPLVGRVPEDLGGGQGLWICAGYTGHGMPVAARCAVEVAKLMLGKHAELPEEFTVTGKRADAARDLELGSASLLDDLRRMMMELSLD